MIYLPNELILLISNYLYDKDILNLSYTFKHFYNILHNFGFLKSISIHPENINVSLNKIIFHQRSLQFISFNMIKNNYINITVWSPVMIFINCNINNLNPTKETKTKTLFLKSFNKYDIIYINWKMFPQLEWIFIRAYDLSNKDYSIYCKKLKRIEIKLNK